MFLKAVCIFVLHFNSVLLSLKYYGTISSFLYYDGREVAPVIPPPTAAVILLVVPTIDLYLWCQQSIAEIAKRRRRKTDKVW